MAKELKDLTKSDENYSQWYNDLVVKAGLAENSAVRGCMVIGVLQEDKLFATLDPTARKLSLPNGQSIMPVSYTHLIGTC